MSKFFAGVLFALATMAALYGIAATIATTMTPRFTSAESTRHMRVSELTDAIKLATDTHTRAHAKCALLTGADKSDCNTEAATAQRRARMEARLAYKSDIKVAGKPAADVSGSARRADMAFDMALYRAHRQRFD